MTDFNNILAETIAYTDLTIMNIVFALVIMVVGFIAAKMIVQMFKSGMEKTKLPEFVIEFFSLQNFLLFRLKAFKTIIKL